MDLKQIINGQEYTVCCPDSFIVADKACKEEHTDYRLSCKKDGTCAQVYMHTYNTKTYTSYIDGETYTTNGNSENTKCLGWLLWDPNTDIVTLRKTSVDSEKHVYNREDCLAVSYDIFKYLRDADVIQIHSDYTDKDGKVTPMIFRIKKYKAAKLGEFKHFKGYGLQYFIPIDAFWKCVDETKLRSKKAAKKPAKKKKATAKK